MCFYNLIEIPLSPIKNKSITYTSQQLRDINKDAKHKKLHLRLNPGTIKISECRINKQEVTTSTKQGHRPRNINTQNLITVKIVDFRGTVTTPYITIATLNARPVKNKDQLLFHELADKQHRHRINHRNMALKYSGG